jgi:four helix bundle protein
MQDFKKLLVWEKSHKFTLDIYRTTKFFPAEEKFGLISQLRRASSSIPANIAEGFGRGGKGEIARFLQIAFGSTTETEYHLLLAKDLGFITPCKYENLNLKVVEIKKMLAGLKKTVRSSDN